MNGESRDGAGRVDRRAFLETGAGALAAAAALGGGSPAEAQAVPKAAQQATALPTRPLGNTGFDVTILNLGTWMSPGGDRLLRFAWANGVRAFDTAKTYGTEPMIGRWIKAMPVPRADLFLATKDVPRTPRQMLAQLDQRLAALQTDYVDLFYVHALGDGDFATELRWTTSDEFKQVAEAARKSGKAKLVGFSTHHPARALLLQAAAEGGWVDVIMLQNNPWQAQQDDLNRALDACAKQGIGLISMKQVAGNVNLNAIAAQVPELQQRGLTPYQGLLHAIWTDERFASVCVSMRNTDQVRENAAAARAFQPLLNAEVGRLRDACVAAGPTMCAGCDGRCARAAGTAAELGNLTRFLTYHDHHGYRGEARRLYAGLDPAARDWHGADLDAARRACPNRLDFARLLPRAEEVLG
jgi:aryl-alcohol dehydrogenase-like predicted oxidoreductase